MVLRKKRHREEKMIILAIEASGAAAGCAVAADGVIRGEFETQFKKTHSQTLVPMMDALRRILGLDMKDVGAVSLTAGPGSFTGLRIGAATAKGLGLALGIPLIPVPTLESLAYNVFGTDALVCPIMDARRQQVYTGIYEEKDHPVVLRDQCAVPVSEIIEDLNARGREVIFLGDGVPVYKDVIRAQMRVPYLFAPAHLNAQRAASTAALASCYLETRKEACLVNADDFRPTYLRKSQAERQREEAEREGAMDALAAGRLVKEERERAKEQRKE